MRWLGLLALIVFLAAGSAAQPPYSVAPGLFDFARPNDLGLKPAPGAQTFVIHAAAGHGDHYVNGVVLMPFKDRLYAQWQSSAKDEDSPDTHVAVAVSSDGEHWSQPQNLTLPGPSMTTSGGWWTDGKMLVAYINVWNGNLSTGGATHYTTSLDGVHWTAPLPLIAADGRLLEGIIEQDPHALPDGRIVTAFHLGPGLAAAPFFTDDPYGLSGWTRAAMANLPLEAGRGRELEPSWFRRADGCLVMVFRDRQPSFRQLASQSCDRGAGWTTPVLTAMPDSGAKQSAGNLPDGTAFLVNAPSGNKLRAPLVISLSRDGRVFDRAFVLRAGPPPAVRFAGKFKRPGYHYPKAVVWNGALWISYASGKEDALVTRVSLP